MLTRSCAASTNLRSPVSVGKLRLAGQLLSHQRTDDPGVFHESVAPALSTRPRALGLVAESFGRRLAIDDDCAARPLLVVSRDQRRSIPASNSHIDRVGSTQSVCRSEFCSLPRHGGGQCDQSQVRETSRRTGVVECSVGVITRAGDGRRDLRQEQGRHDDRVATLMDRRQDRQALCVTLLVRVESVDEDARVDGVSALIASHLP